MSSFLHNWWAPPGEIRAFIIHSNGITSTCIINDLLPTDKYHGLVNQGSTCYLNSVLQVLFMTEDFREAVNRFVTKSNFMPCKALSFN